MAQSEKKAVKSRQDDMRHGSDYVCPYCRQQAGFYGKFKIEEFHLDPLVDFIGVCWNEECLNSPLFKPALKEFDRIMKAVFKDGPVDLDKFGKRWKELVQKSKVFKKIRKIVGPNGDQYCCPKCKQWTLNVEEDSAPGGFYAKCLNPKCGKELVINRT